MSQYLFSYLTSLCFSLLERFLYTPCPSAPVRYALVASPVDNFAEIASPVQNYAFPANK